jgi:hypothetical protein
VTFANLHSYRHNTRFDACLSNCIGSNWHTEDQVAIAGSPQNPRYIVTKGRLVDDDWRIQFAAIEDAQFRGDPDAGRVACESLLSRREVPHDARAAALRSSVLYTRRLQELIPETKLIEIFVPTPPGRTAFNPSIYASRHGLMMAVRSTNWEFIRDRHYRVNAPDGVARSENYLVRLGSSLTPEEIELLEDGTDRTGEVASQFRGYHDLRLFEHDGQLRAVAHTLDFSPLGLSQVALLDITDRQLTRRRLLTDGKTRHEKNWSPAIWNGELFFVYSYAPMVLRRWDGSRLLPAGLDSYVAPPIAVDFRGGSQLVAIEGGYLTVVHTGADFADTSRVYLHRFVSFDEEFRITGVSPQFIFQEPGIEFAAGLAIWGDTAIVSFGLQDRESWLARLPLAQVIGVLSPPVQVDPVPLV